MKRLMQVWVMILCLVLFVFTSVYAETITALASPVNPEHLENTASYARILGYDEARNTLTVELIVPEVFAEEDVLALEVGDSIFTGGQEVLIRSIDRYEDDGYLVINAGAYEHAPGSVYLHMDEWGNYMPDATGIRPTTRSPSLNARSRTVCCSWTIQAPRPATHWSCPSCARQPSSRRPSVTVRQRLASTTSMWSLTKTGNWPRCSGSLCRGSDEIL